MTKRRRIKHGLDLTTIWTKEKAKMLTQWFNKPQITRIEKKKTKVRIWMKEQQSG
jgi:hypothetical protein